jgi:hypothetical protein
MKSSLRFLAAFGVAAALLGGGCMPNTQPEPTTITQPASSTVLEFKTVTTKKGKTDSLRNIKVDSSGGKLSDPLKITGEARLWYFEAVFPIELRDSAGRMLGLGPAQAQSDWMTEEWVPFEVQFTFPEQPAGSRGTIIMMNDNPSGLEENSDSFEIPVTF